MRFAPLDRHFTGISIPVAALRTSAGCGVGEFADLVPLGAWCREAGLDVIQLLPVNDTGTNSSPYSALSAFALHPLYLNLDALPGGERHAAEIRDFRENAPRGRFSYQQVLAFKLEIIEKVCAENAKAIAADKTFAQWRKANPWVIPYSVFTALKKQHANAPWASWGDMASPSAAQVTAWWEAHLPLCMPAEWVQFQLETQLASASHALEKQGVFLKGDLPILMSRESADVWAERAFFDLTGIAGAPPDMFSPDGQNWGFPIYDWESLGREGYRWWKDRLKQAGKFFHVFRIDHVLGFFRIWRIPQGEVTGLLGRFSPSSSLSREGLASIGFDNERLRWLSVPHVSGAEIAAALGGSADHVTAAYLRRIGGENLFNIAPEYDSESAVHALDEPPAVKAFLLSWHGNRALLDDGTGGFSPAWYLESKKGYQGLSAEEKNRLGNLVGQRRRESEEGWETTGRRLLSVLQGATDMLVCAEDLGDVPRCVPRVLDSLGILGLRIVRWAREYETTPPGRPAPFIPPSRYPLLSVCTPSVHDTSTLRGWWEEDAAERELFFRSLGEQGACPPRMQLPLLSKIMAHCAGAQSLLCMFQVQDLLDLDQELWSADPGTDRINVPGTVTEQNWTWRMPVSVEDLSRRTGLRGKIRTVVDGRRKAAVTENAR
jgi:4-alpha-glucanotransferase